YLLSHNEYLSIHPNWQSIIYKEKENFYKNWSLCNFYKIIKTTNKGITPILMNIQGKTAILK
ncbi:hypothetical protein, partial [Bacteroides caecimuris]|uniref:hypothetical protein n=1 Tax=Bacteroides caecimuris TaxID=1796613 RepID=UPI00265AA3C4